MNRFSIIVKLAAILTIFFLGIVLFLSIANVLLAQKNFRESEQHKVRIILDTMVPVVGINLSFGFVEAIDDTLSGILENNENILAVLIYNNDDQVLYQKFAAASYKNIFVQQTNHHFEEEQKIFDPFTNETLGKIRIAYSSQNYESLIQDYRYFLVASVAIAILLFGIFLDIFYRLLAPLKSLATQMEKITPEKITVEIPPAKGRDEIAIITNAARAMLTKLKEYTRTLQGINATLTQQVAKEVAKNREKDQLLIKQSRMAAMGEMIGNIAHQWRQPLNALGLLVQDVKEAYEFGEIDQAYIDKTVSKAMRLINRMSTTIDDFRDFFNPNKEKEEFLVKHSIEDALGILTGSLEHYSIELHVNIPVNPVVYG